MTQQLAQQTSLIEKLIQENSESLKALDFAKRVASESQRAETIEMLLKEKAELCNRLHRQTLLIASLSQSENVCVPCGSARFMSIAKFQVITDTL
jgi:hypothetical protein